MVDRLPRVPDLPRADEYLSELDRHLSASEQDALLDLAESLGFSLDTAMDLHRRYLTALAQAALADDIVTEAERQDLLEVADPDSLSGKAGKARQYGIPIVTEDAFAQLLERMDGSR